MMSVSEVPIGSLVFLECGCCGVRGVSPPETFVPVAIQRACPAHRNEPVPRLVLLKAAALVSPFAHPASHESEP